MAERIELPTKAEIAAMTDPAAVKRWIEDVEGVVTTIETRLSYSGINDDDWRGRAQGALIRNQIALRQLNRRAHDLRFVALRHPSRLHGQKTKATSKPANDRPDSENDPLTNEALDQDHAVDLRAVTEIGQADAMLAALEARIAAVARDRDDEIATPAQKRDEGFLAATKSALAAMRNSRSVLQTHRNRLVRGTAGTTQEGRLARQAHRAQLFIDAARDLLPAATFVTLWDRVDRQEIEAARPELAAMADILNFKARPTQAPAPDDASVISRPCPFCGEGEDLSLGEMERGFTDGPDKTFVPAVFCERCDATAPLDAWNCLLAPYPGAA